MTNRLLQWVLLIFSAIFYAIPYTCKSLYWLIFLFPVPLLYLGCTQSLSFVRGYIWGFIVFLLHLRDGIVIVADLARDFWWFGILMGLGIVVYQALIPGILFCATTRVIEKFSIKSLVSRLFLWICSLAVFIFWVDRYCLWIFGIPEGYPLMHPLIVLTHQGGLLLLLPVLGKQLLTILFLLVPGSFVLLLWYKNKKSMFFFVIISGIWIMSWLIGFSQEKQAYWYDCLKSLPYMVHCTSKNPEIIMKIVARHIRDIVTKFPCSSTIIMPESALNITDFENKPELLRAWSEEHIGKPVNIIFGTCRMKNDHYYNSLHWVHNGVLQAFFDKKHAMLITEQLPHAVNYDFLRSIYFKEGISITRSCNDRMLLKLSDDIQFVPYICSELFFNEYPDDCYKNIPIMVIVNDTLLRDSFMQNLLLLLAQFRAIQWQREIIYVSYSRSVIIDKRGMMEDMNE